MYILNFVDWNKIPLWIPWILWTENSTRILTSYTCGQSHLPGRTMTNIPLLASSSPTHQLHVRSSAPPIVMYTARDWTGVKHTWVSILWLNTREHFTPGQSSHLKLLQMFGMHFPLWEDFMCGQRSHVNSHIGHCCLTVLHGTILHHFSIGGGYCCKIAPYNRLLCHIILGILC